jgi:hypothetical protein
MTETDWQTTADPLALLGHLFPDRGHDSTEPAPRKLRLYYVACARRAWDRLPPVCRELVEFAEERADGRTADAKLRHAVYEVADRLVGSCREEPAVVAEALADAREQLAALFGREVGETTDPPPAPWAGFAQLVYAPFDKEPARFRFVPPGLHDPALVRDVFRYPAGLTLPDPAWRSSAVLGLAAPMYAARDFTLMPVLADALEDAGCTDPRVLDHCRRPGPHARGCWVLDLQEKL